MLAKWIAAVLACCALLAVATEGMAETQHRIGAGVHYWRTLDDIDADDIDEDGIAWVVSYQLRPASFVGLQADLEVMPDDFGGADERVLAPAAFLVVGTGVYAGLGVGIYYTDGDFADDPFFVLRAGLDLELLPSLHLDLNANYRFEEWASIETVDEDIDTDTVTLGAALRLEL